MARTPKIALLIQTSRAYGRGVLRGIAGYVQSNEPWSIYHDERILAAGVPEWLGRWKGDGIIGWLESPRLTRKIARMGIPAVDVLGLHESTGIPVIDTDECAVARLAADHLLDCGFEHFAYCGFPGLHYSDERSAHFAEYLREKGGHEVHVYRGPTRHAVRTYAMETVGLLDEAAVAAWIRSLPKPVGLMAGNDTRGQQVVNACTEYGIAVPKEVAVIGVNNDEVLCNLCHPTLSSVETDLLLLGHTAAAQLDGLMRGRRPAQSKTLVKPLSVAWRESTRVVAFADLGLARAVQFIRQHACEGIGVADVLRHVPVSRSTLMRHFLQRFGRSPRAEIVRLQMQRVKDLLVHTDLPLTKIARLAGFDYVESMCRLFNNLAGRAPGDYRRESRIANHPERAATRVWTPPAVAARR